MLVVGLGNPGKRYCGTPHNVGFRVLDVFVERRLAENHRAAVGVEALHTGGPVENTDPVPWSQRFGAELARARVEREELVLLKPQTFMNRSGESVREALSFFELDEASTLVVHDELDLPLGTLKLKRGGGEAGHNGLKSVSAELGTRDYCRLRVGVGRPVSGEVADFLLSPLSSADAVRLEESIGAASEAISLVARHGVDRAMAVVNRPPPVVTPPATGRPD